MAFPAAAIVDRRVMSKGIIERHVIDMLALVKVMKPSQNRLWMAWKRAQVVVAKRAEVQ